jgi:hypothetical protein
MRAFLSGLFTPLFDEDSFEKRVFALGFTAAAALQTG